MWANQAKAEKIRGRASNIDGPHTMEKSGEGTQRKGWYAARTEIRRKESIGGPKGGGYRGATNPGPLLEQRKT